MTPPDDPIRRGFRNLADLGGCLWKAFLISSFGLILLASALIVHGYFFAIPPTVHVQPLCETRSITSLQLVSDRSWGRPTHCALLTGTFSPDQAAPTPAPRPQPLTPKHLSRKEFADTLSYFLIRDEALTAALAFLPGEPISYFSTGSFTHDTFVDPTGTRAIVVHW